MRLKHLTCVLSAGVLAGSVQPLRAASTIYNSAGFESPRFTTGNIDSQDGGLWIESGGGSAGTASVENTTAFGGSQAVIVSRTDSSQNGGDKRYWPSTSAVSPTASQFLVNVTWDMNVTKNTTPGVTTGPFFGIEAFDPNVNLIAAAGVDATTGEILFGDPAFSGGFNNTTADDTVTLGTWNHFFLSMNFTSHTASVYVNGSLKQVVPGFDTAGISQFLDADLSAIATDVEPINQTGTAYFDNYSVVNTNSVPEPSSLAGIALASLSLLRRRRVNAPVPTGNC